jgi:hypothetical protein
MTSAIEPAERTQWRRRVPSIFLVFNSFVWYILTAAVFITVLDGLQLPGVERLELYAIFFFSSGVAAVVGSKLFPLARTAFLNLWVFVGAIATLLLLEMSRNSMLTNAFIVLFLGVSIAVGLPSCLAYFADSTVVENRGLTAGVTWSAVGFGVLMFALLINMLRQADSVVALTGWRLFGCGTFLALNRNHTDFPRRKSPSYLQLIRRREILLYLFPWIMFSLINFAEAPILERFFGAEFFAFVQLIGWAFIGVFAIVGGFVADVAGRKRVVITGFIMLGIEYATMSLFSISPLSWYFFLTLDGITWGLFASIFWMALWGDLGGDDEKEKYYALGGLPYLLAGFLPILLRPYVGLMGTVESFSLASFFLFLAVLPLMYAPETLPEKKIKDRELKDYLDKAKKVKEKYT